MSAAPKRPQGRKPERGSSGTAAQGRIRIEAYPDGATIYGPASPADRFYLLRTGRVRLFRPGNDGTRCVVSILRAGDLFGEVLPGRGGAMEEAAVAAGDTEVLSVGVQDFRELIEAQPDLAGDVIAALNERLRALRNRVATLTTRDVRARLAQALLDLGEAHGERCVRHGGDTDLTGITHRDLADLVGASRAFVSVRLGELRREGVLARGSGWTICLRDLRGLREMARGRRRARGRRAS
jgi:CRP-like cAMP-binding protein